MDFALRCQEQRQLDVVTGTYADLKRDLAGVADYRDNSDVLVAVAVGEFPNHVSPSRENLRAFPWADSRMEGIKHVRGQGRCLESPSGSSCWPSSLLYEPQCRLLSMVGSQQNDAAPRLSSYRRTEGRVLHTLGWPPPT